MQFEFSVENKLLPKNVWWARLISQIDSQAVVEAILYRRNVLSVWSDTDE